MRDQTVPRIPRREFLKRGATAAGLEFDQKASAVRTVTLPPGPSYVDLAIIITEPQLWWPWSHPELGKPALYDLHSALFKPLTIMRRRKK